MESRVIELTSCNPQYRQWSNLRVDGQLCRDLNPAARDIVDKHLRTTPPREITVDSR